MAYGIDDTAVQQRATVAGFETVHDNVADLLQRDAQRLAHEAEIREAYAESAADIEAGRTQPLAAAMLEIREKHELR